ncbi:SGNH/GDSL hydrolase family protein [Paracoccus aminovorans]|uniref:SGNH/GDSL hydrolase family protein n=1 Tax=Paracoccus aminovorans TaxID=34004 RepID=UPI0007863A0D|nr:SGNH/GDSL hydrolase family protein [Paracoccus aminovorans]
MGDRILKWIGILAILALVGLAGYFAWPRPPHPPVPVPTLDMAQAGFQARLVPPQSGLVPLPAQVTGRSAAGPAPGSRRHEWPGFHAAARFHGSAVTLRFDDAVNRWRVTLDGQAILVSRPGWQDLHITGLAPGPHLVLAEKISESQAPAVFDGFFLDAGAEPLPAPPPPARLIEFIGDSDTLGLADTALRRDCSEEQVFSATDTSRAFGAQVARALGTDYRIIARSGIGLLRNYGGARPGREMPQIYPLALPRDPAAPTLPQRSADILVIALGSNDFGSDFAKGERWDKATLAADFGPALADFARARLAENPGARLVLLAFGEYGHELTDAYRTASDLLAADGLAAEVVVLREPRRNACLWHPSQADHDAIAKVLSQVLKTPD